MTGNVMIYTGIILTTVRTADSEARRWLTELPHISHNSEAAQDLRMAATKARQLADDLEAKQAAMEAA